MDHEYTKVGSYLVTLTVIREADPPKSTTATVTISVEPGPLESLVLDLDEVVLAPREEHVFLVSAFDQFDNPIPGLEPDYQVDDQAGSVDGHGNFTAAATAGTYTGALNVHLSQGSITRSTSASVIIEPGSLDRVGLEPIAVSIDILDVIKFSAAAYDRFGNPIEGLDTIFVTDTKVGQVNDRGTFIAGTKTGTHQRGVVAEVTDGTRTRTGGSMIIINPGKLDQVRVEPDVATLSVTEEQQFKATALDQFENPIPDLPVTFQADELVGEVDGEGNFLAATVPGVYDRALTVEVSQGVITSTATANITIESGPLDRIVVDPATATLDVTSQLQFVATGVDSFDNSIPDITFTFQSDQLAGEIDADGFLTASTLAGIYDVGVTVEGSQGDITKEAEALVIIEPGPLEQVTLEPTILEVAVTGAIQIVAQGLDEFANPIVGLPTTFRTDLQAGQIDDEGNFTAGTKAGTFPEGVTVELSQGALTRTAAAQVVVEPGTVDRVLLSVDNISLDIGDSHGFTAQAVDTFDNPILGAEISWVAAEEVGTITNDGLITVGTMAGTFEQAITGFATVGDVSVGASASVTVNPDPLATLSVLPVAIVAADTQQLVISAADRFGNPIEDLDVVWSLEVDDAGSVTSSGELTAGEVAQSFLGATEALVTQVEVTLIATGDLTITPGPLDQVVVAPGLAEIGMGESQQFVAVGADQFGNLIPDLTITWSVEEGEGSINGAGLYSAGVVASTGVSVKATAVQGTIARDGTASITVEPDRIAFTSDQEGIDQVYTMGSNGSNVESVTIGGAFNFDWTVNGRGLVYESPEGIVSINDNGSWPILLLRDVIDFDFGIYLLNFEPRYSPDGTKIAFVEVEFPPLEDGSPDFENFDRDILVMDVDGGNVVRLTDTSDGDEFVPSWSPDGAQIVYDFTPVGELGDIWVLSLDGEVGWEKWTPKSDKLERRRCQDEAGPARKVY